MTLWFDAFEVDEARFELRRAGVPVHIERRVFDLIAYLARNSDRVITKAELFDRVWPGRKVAEGSLTVAISAARRALGDDVTRQETIRTHQGRGYRFVKPILARKLEQGRSSLAPENGSTSDFVGRTSELQTFLSILDIDVKHASILLLSGEPGIGKSRLLTEFQLLASLRGFPTHIVRCPESERTPYLWPCQQIIRKLTVDRPDSLADLLPAHHARFLSPLLPEHFDRQADHFSTDPDAARFQAFEALTLLLRALSGERRQILAIDDFHRADDGTARFLQFAAMELRDTPLVIVATYRPLEASLAPIHARSLAALAREPNALQLQLSGLNASDTFALATALSSAPLPDSAQAELHAHTGGNPFFIRQLLPLLPGRTASGKWASIPSSLAQAIAARVSVLSEATQSLLKAAAAIGREFDTRVLAAASESSDIDGCLQQAIDAGVLTVSPEHPTRATFPHVLVRDVLYSRLSISEKRLLHLRIGEALDSDAAEFSEHRAGEIAHHLVNGGADLGYQRALELAEKAGHSASRRSAHEDASHHFALALDAINLLDQDSQTRKCHLLLARGEAQCRAGERAAAKTTFRDAAALAATLGASDELARAALGVAPGILAAEAGVSDAFLEQLLTDAMRSLGEAAVDLRALLAARLAMAIHWSERDSTMLELMETARGCLTRTSDPKVRLHVLFAEWFCGWNSRRMGERHALAEEIQTIADRVRDREMALVGMVLRMVGMLERGDMTSFDNTLLCFDDLARLLRQPQSLWYASMFKGMRALVDGRLDDAAMRQSEFATIAARVEDANAFHSLAAQATLLQREKGTLEGLLGMLDDGARRYPAIRGFRAGFAWSLMKVGRDQDAAREFEVLAANNFRSLPERYDWSALVWFASEVCAGLGDRRRAKVL